MRVLRLTSALVLAAACAPLDDTDRDVASAPSYAHPPASDRLALAVTVEG